MNCLKPTGASPPAAAETTRGQQDERTARRAPASNSGSKGKRVNGEDQGIPHARIQQQTILGPRGAPGPMHGHFPRPQQVRQNRGSDQPDSGATPQCLRGVFEKIYIFSPSIGIDDGWIPVKKYLEEDLGANTEKEHAYWEDWDEAALRGIMQRQRKITETSKKLEMKKLYQALIILDDLSDMPQLHKANGALDTLFIRGRHMQISTWVSSQKLRLISAAVRVNQQFLCCWRLRNQHELEAVIEELSALQAAQDLRAGDQGPLQLPLRVLPQAKE